MKIKQVKQDIVNSYKYQDIKQIAGISQSQINIFAFNT